MARIVVTGANGQLGTEMLRLTLPEGWTIQGFTRAEALTLFGKSPAGYDLVIDPLPAPIAQQRYLERYRVLAEAVGLVPAPDAWHTE